MEDMTMLQNLFESFTLNTNFLTWALLIGVVIDFITGIAKGYKLDGKVSSKKLRNGGFKKAGIVLVVVLSYVLSVLFTDTNHIIFNSVQCYYIYMEIISTLENLDELGVRLPKMFTKILGDNKESEEN